jgi:hypothetical protein
MRQFSKTAWLEASGTLNPKHEIRNSKQIQMTKIRMKQTMATVWVLCFGFFV